MKQIKIVLFALLASAGLGCCSSDPVSDLTYEDSQVFMTNRTHSIDFKQYKTYSIVDSVTLIENNRSGPISQPTDRAVLSEIKSRMDLLGYTYVTKTEKPDVGVDVKLYYITQDYIVSQPVSSYWGGFYGGWNYGYPMYYNSYVQVSDLFWSIDMLDFKNADSTTKKVDVVWNAQIRGNGVYEPTLAKKMVDGIFAQSTYLNIK